MASASSVAKQVVGIGEFAFCRPPQCLQAIGLGSCVAVILYDPRLQLAGLLHAMLPEAPATMAAEDKRAMYRYVRPGLQAALEELQRHGASKRRLRAVLVGGAHMFDFGAGSYVDIGPRNVRAALEVLQQLGVEVVARATGGKEGRTVVVEPQQGEVRVRTIGGLQRRLARLAGDGGV